ncbi:MAG: hypothetical protein ACOYM5_08460 [Caulobacter sp.]
MERGEARAAVFAAAAVMEFTKWWWAALIAVVSVRLVAFVLRVEREHRESSPDGEMVDDEGPFTPVFVITLTPQHYVYIEDDGTSRELTAEEAIFLKTPFNEDDLAQPYIKWSYEELTHDGKIGGFLERRLLPSEIAKAERFARTLRSD